VCVHRNPSQYSFLCVCVCVWSGFDILNLDLSIYIYISIYIHIVAWVILAIVVAQWTSFFSVLWKSEMANRTLLRIAAMGAGIVTSLIVYLVVYLPKVKGLTDSSAWSVYCPKVIPTMTATSILTYLIALRGTWPVWGFLSPLIFGIQLMGGLMVLHFVPAGNWC
jgi:hypothetical protein